MTNLTASQGSQAFLVFIPNQNQMQGQLSSLFNQATHRVQIPGMSNAYIVMSNANLTDWYQGMDTNAADAVPVIVPVDISSLRSITGNLPQFLQEFLNHQAVRAA
jgi:hypothetical protein